VVDQWDHDGDSEEEDDEGDELATPSASTAPLQGRASSHLGFGLYSRDSRDNNSTVSTHLVLNMTQDMLSTASFGSHGHIGNNKFMQDDTHMSKRPSTSWGAVAGSVRGGRNRASSAHPTRGSSSRDTRDGGANKRKAFRGDVIREDDRSRMTFLMSKLASLRVEQTSRDGRDRKVLPKERSER
jgi:hypothetical protein